MNMIVDKLIYNVNDKYWTITYPWLKDPNDLPNNFSSAFARLRSTEKDYCYWDLIIILSMINKLLI